MTCPAYPAPWTTRRSTCTRARAINQQRKTNMTNYTPTYFDRFGHAMYWASTRFAATYFVKDMIIREIIDFNGMYCAGGEL